VKNRELENRLLSESKAGNYLYGVVTGVGVGIVGVGVFWALLLISWGLFIATVGNGAVNLGGLLFFAGIIVLIHMGIGGFYYILGKRMLLGSHKRKTKRAQYT
jgi:hypothetical protein